MEAAREGPAKESRPYVAMRFDAVVQCSRLAVQEEQQGSRQMAAQAGVPPACPSRVGVMQRKGNGCLKPKWRPRIVAQGRGAGRQGTTLAR